MLTLSDVYQDNALSDTDAVGGVGYRCRVGWLVVTERESRR